MEYTVKTITCPSCGAILHTDEDVGIIRCEYCDTQIALKSDEELKKELERKRETEELKRKREQDI